MKLNMEYEELTENIIECILIELRKAELDAESQKPITVTYEN